MKHKEIESIVFFLDKITNSAIVANRYDLSNKEEHHIVFGTRVAPDEYIMNLLISAPILYQQLTLQQRAIEGLIEVMKRIPNSEPIVECLRDLQNACQLAQLVACEGFSAVTAMEEDNIKWS